MRPSRLFMTFRLYQSAFPTLNTISSLEKAPAYNARGGETRVGCFFSSSCAFILDVAFAKGNEVSFFERLEVK
ncbi:hypothetical protein NDU88_004277 [Pleurodeles waltl]|uniref:Uncharacterized protein n=1 Tax=Pleurodeles waltl TaxID=8319 RepID=A0AAV7T7P5_PLEWA|nr:hypothetical protein NDU88_004277 [Pleurodeles waltl]